MVYTFNESEHKDNLLRYRDIKHHDFIKHWKIPPVSKATTKTKSHKSVMLLFSIMKQLWICGMGLFTTNHVSVTNRQGGKERTLYGGEAHLCKVAEGDQDDPQKDGKSNSDLAASTPDSPCPKYQHH